MACVAMVLSTTLFAQSTSTKNTYSIYSIYGIGEISTQGTLSTRSMGGAGLASRSGTSINLLNPASYSIAIRQGILVDIGVGGSYITNSQSNGGNVSKSGYLAGNLHNVSLQVPLAKGLGLGFSLSPYSSVGYYLNDYELDKDLGIISTSYSGSGDITEVKLGVGWQIAKGLSIGASAQYYWGSLERYYSLAIYPVTTSGSYSTALGVSDTYISKIKGQFGVQWDAMFKDNRRLTFGATYDMGGQISPSEEVIISSGSSSDIVDVESRDEVAYPELKFPHQFSVGVMYRDRRWHTALDYSYQMWSGNSSTLTTKGVDVAYTDVSQIRVGLEYTPNRMDSRNYFKRSSYRVGGRLSNYYQTFGGETLTQWSVTAGVGVPINVFGMSNVDFGLEYGGLGSMKSVGSVGSTMNLVKQNYFKFAVGVTLFGDDYWFQRIKYD